MIHSLTDLFAVQLRKLYDIELQHLHLLPSLIRVAASPELKKAFHSHLEETRDQIERLDTSFGELGTESVAEPCPTMEALVKEYDAILCSEVAAPVRDAALIAASQCIEHHEIAEYGTCRAYAQQLGFSKIADRLQITLDEESRADNRLTLLAEGSLFHGGINAEANASVSALAG